MSKIEKAQSMEISGVLFAPTGFKLASTKKLESICNGCGAANAKFDFVPDRIYGTCITYACHIHYFMYNEGLTIEDKQEADRVFLNNLLRLIDKDKHKWYKPTKLQRIRAKEYYQAVDWFGGPAFFNGK
jgi:hypothetical protein